MKLSEDVAFVLHEKFRQTKLKEDGSYEPCWEKINDTEFISRLNEYDLPCYVRLSENGYEIDIANACFEQLSADWQKESKAAAEVVAKVIESRKQLSRDQIGDFIHNAWLKRNPGEKDGKLGVPFTKLSKEEQGKYMVQYDVALTISQATLEERYINRLEDVVTFLTGAKGQNIAYEFNGHTLYSEFDTPDTCYLKSCGMTVKENQMAEEKWEKEYDERKARHAKEAKTKIPQWEKRGEALIYPERKNNWHECVKASAQSMYHSCVLANTLDIMEALEQGKTIEEATKIAEDQEHSGFSWSVMMRMVATFSKQGPAFYRANNKDLNPDIEEYLQKLESENNLYAEKIANAEKISETENI